MAREKILGGQFKESQCDNINGLLKSALIFLAECPEGSTCFDQRKERIPDVGNSENEIGRRKIGSLRKNALHASTKLTHSLKKRSKRKVEFRVPSFSVEDVRDAEEERAVNAFRQELIAKQLLPDKFDDYHTLLRLDNLFLIV